MPKQKADKAVRFNVRMPGGKRLAFRADGALDEQLAKLEIFFGCTRQRVVEILAADAIARYYEPVLDEAMEIVKLNPDGSVIDADMVRRYLATTYSINEEAAAEIEARAARKLRWRLAHPVPE
jgi:hypothetical protein